MVAGPEHRLRALRGDLVPVLRGLLLPAPPLVLPWAYRHPQGRRIATLAWFGGTCATYYISYQHQGLHPGWDVFAFTNPVINFGLFALGALAAIEIRCGWRPTNRNALVLVALGEITTYYTPASKPLPVIPLTAIFAGIILLAVNKELTGRPGILSHPALVYAGEVSFAFYLVHELTMCNLVGITHRTGTTTVLVILAVAAVLAVALHEIVEKPLQRRLRGPASSKSPTTGAVLTRVS